MAVWWKLKFQKKTTPSPLIQGEQEIKCLLTIEVEIGESFQYSYKEFLNSNYDFENRDSDDRNSSLKEIENKMNTRLDSISSDEDLVQMDDEHIWFQMIKTPRELRFEN